MEQATKPQPFQVDLSPAPENVVAATRVRLVDRGSNFVLVYLVEYGQKSPPLACEIVMTAGALAHFARRGSELVARVPGADKVRDCDREDPLSEDWQPAFGIYRSNAVFNAATSDLVSSDFYYVPPRHVIEARARPPEGGAPISLKARALVSCTTSMSEFRRLVHHAAEVAIKRVDELNVRHLVNL